MLLQKKDRLRSAKNVIFALLCILVDRPMGGGLNPQSNPPCVRPWLDFTSNFRNNFVLVMFQVS